MALPTKPVLTPVPVPLPQRGQVETVFTPAMNSFIAWTPNHQQNLIDVLNWIQAAYGETGSVYDDTVIAKNAAVQSATAASVSSAIAVAQADRAEQEADRAVLVVQDAAEDAAALATQIATAQANRAAQEADRSELFAGESQSAATSALNTVSSLTPRLGLNIGNWKIEDGELIVSHLTTATPTIVQGDFILTYEEIEDFA